MSKAKLLTELVERAKAGDDLAMDYASRMQRAKEMGFPQQTNYRGLSEPYDESKISHLIWTTDNPEYASAYAYGGPDKQNIGKGSNVMPIKVRAENPFDFGYRSQFTEVKYGDMLDRIRLGANAALGRGDITMDQGLEIIDKVKDLRDGSPDVNAMRPVYSWWNNKPEMIELLKDLGHDSLIAKEGIEDNISTLAAFDPSQVRSVNAAFDPAKKESANLLASAAPVAVGLGALGSGDKSYANIINAPGTYQPYSAAEKLSVGMPDQITGASYPVLGGIANMLHSIDSPIGKPYETTAELLGGWAYGRPSSTFDKLMAIAEIASPESLPSLVAGGAEYLRKQGKRE